MSVNVAKEVISIIADVSGYDEDEIKLESKLAEDLEIDSIKAIEIAVFVEKKFKISLRDEDIAKIITVQEILDLASKLVEEKVN
jgi:acyl carrier protein